MSFLLFFCFIFPYLSLSQPFVDLTPLLFFSPCAATGRTRVNSESQALSVSREEELQANWEEEAGTPTDGVPFRGRSKSAPPALWAAKKYGRQLRRMSDEFDSLLDKGVRMSGARVWGFDFSAQVLIHLAEELACLLFKNTFAQFQT